MNDDFLTDHNDLLRYELFDDMMDNLYDILLRNHFTHVEMDDICTAISDQVHMENRIKYNLLDAVWDIQ